MRKNGFTLIELIVVITILAILGTISFISFKGYTSETRDAKVISDIVNIHKGLSLYKIKNSFLPIPSSSVEIKSGTTTITYEGEIGDTVKNSIKSSNDLFSPAGTEYLYATNGTNKYFNIIGMLENEQVNLTTTAYAKDADVKYFKGDEILTLFDSDGTFVDTEADIESLSSNNYEAYLGEETLVVNSNVVQNVPAEIVQNKLPVPNPLSICTQQGEILSATTYYNGCNTADIIVCSGARAGYILSACNVGTTKSGITSESYGNYFQWGNNYPFGLSATTTTIQVDASLNGPGNYFKSNVFIKLNSDWSSIQNNNLWGDTTNTNNSRQGVCKNGYHIPTEKEWRNIISAGKWGSSGVEMQTDLKLPYSGELSRNTGRLINDGTHGYYWTSSPSGTRSYNMWFSSNAISPSYGFNDRSFAFPIRCLKN